MSRLVTPYSDSKLSKQQQVTKMFDSIALKYDFLNHFFSLGIDKLWRRKAVRLLEPHKPKKILDVATGTADFAIALTKISPNFIVGTDLSEKMLEKGRKKIKNKSLQELITLEVDDGSNMKFRTDSFDAVTIGFGIRNFEFLEKGLLEMNRVLKFGGVLCVLEFANPEASFFKSLYDFYFKRVMPLFGKLLSKDPIAYSYLNKSVESFGNKEKFCEKIISSGFNEVELHSQFFGSVMIYLAFKK